MCGFEHFHEEFNFHVIHLKILQFVGEGWGEVGVGLDQAVSIE